MLLFCFPICIAQKNGPFKETYDNGTIKISGYIENGQRSGEWKEYFDVNLAGSLGLSGAQRIIVTFKIDKSGAFVDVRARASHSKLAKEAERVVSSLPKIKPGKQRGKAVTVPYSLPIQFNVKKN